MEGLNRKTKKAIIAGSSSQIGEWIGDELIKQEYEVFGLSREKSKYTVIKGVDITNIKALYKRFNKIKKEIKTSKYMFYCCGTAHLSSIEESNPELWKRDIDVNLIGAYNFYKVISHIKNIESQTNFIFIGSTSVVSKGAELSSYAIAKEGLETLVKYINNEGPSTWRATCIRLGTCKKSLSGKKNNDYINDEDVRSCVKYLLGCRNNVFPDLISIRPLKKNHEKYNSRSSG